MSNRTIKGAVSVHGQDPQLLIEKIVRERIYDNVYWKEHCFGKTAETILDLAVELDHVGGYHSNQRPVPFLCLLLKLLQIQPSLEIVEEYIEQDDFKYLRALALFYARLVLPAARVYSVLEPFYADRRRLRLRSEDGSFALLYIDELVDNLLQNDRVFGIILPRLAQRTVLEDNEELEARKYYVDQDESDEEHRDKEEED